MSGETKARAASVRVAMSTMKRKPTVRMKVGKKNRVFDGFLNSSSCFLLMKLLYLFLTRVRLKPLLNAIANPWRLEASGGWLHLPTRQGRRVQLDRMKSRLVSSKDLLDGGFASSDWEAASLVGTLISIVVIITNSCLKQI